MWCVEVSRLALFFLLKEASMYLLYADDSGVSSDPNVTFSVLAGFATFENQTFWIQKAVDEIMMNLPELAKGQCAWTILKRILVILARKRGSISAMPVTYG